MPVRLSTSPFVGAVRGARWRPWVAAMALVAFAGPSACGSTAASAPEPGADGDAGSGGRDSGANGMGPGDASSIGEVAGGGGDDRAAQGDGLPQDGARGDVLGDRGSSGDVPLLDGPGVDGASAIDASASDGRWPADVTPPNEGSSSSDGAPMSDSGPKPDATTLLCNGHQALCDRRFDEVVFPTAHNAMSNSDEGWIAPNHVHGMTRQLNDGIRAMLLDTHPFQGTSYLCHSSCLLGNKLLVDGLRELTTFLQTHPNEVLALVIEDHITAAETETAFVASGLIDFVFTKNAGSAWPALRTMIETGRRVVVGAEGASPPPAWYHHFYDLAWDTPYSFRTTSEFSCQENRGNRANSLFLLNHWLENPLADENLSRTANARDVLLSRARQCQTESGKLPNFVAVNHYSVGDLFDVVRELNGL